MKTRKQSWSRARTSLIFFLLALFGLTLTAAATAYLVVNFIIFQ